MPINFTQKELEYIEQSKALMPLNFYENVADDNNARDIRIKAFVELIIDDFNLFPPLTGYTIETFPLSYRAIVKFGVQLFALLFEQMGWTLMDFNYSEGGLSLNPDRVGKIEINYKNMLEIYKDRIESGKRIEMMNVGPKALGTPRYNSSIGQFLKVALGCIDLHTQILTKVGYKPIYLLKSERDFVLGHDLKFHKILCVMKRICNEPMFELKTKKSLLFLTGEHPVYIQNGKVEWKVLKDINIKKDNCYILEKDKLKPIKIINIKKIEYNNYLYNLEVSEVNSFIANNIAIHNSSFTWNSP